MKMSEDLIKEAFTLVVGKQFAEIVNFIHGKKYINEFLIAKKMDITINQTRNILYRLSDHGLVSSTRKKDKRKGWYTYFWKVEILKTLEFLKDIIVKRIEQFNNQVKSRETKNFYICERCNIEFNEENALLHEFTCDECGDIFTMKDNSKLLNELNKNIDKLKKRLKIVDEEIEKEQEILDKEKEKELKKVEKEKAKKRAEKKAARKKVAKKKPAVKKKTIKKSAKKKVSKKTPKKKTAKKSDKKKSSKKKSGKKKIPAGKKPVKKKAVKKKSPTKKKSVKKSSKKKISRKK